MSFLQRLRGRLLDRASSDTGSGAVPRTLYKYVPPARTTILGDGLVRFTQPSELNDPAEGTLAFFPSTTPVRSPLPGAADMIRQVLRDTRENQRRFFNSEVALLSLSESVDNALMWAHYAQSHAGFAIGLNTADAFFATYPNRALPWGRLWPVEYQSLSQAFSVDADSLESLFLFLAKASQVVRAAAENGEPPRDIDPEFALRLWRASYFTKSTDWAYEREWRLIEHVSKAAKSLPADPLPVCLFQVPPSAIAEVILGAKSSRTTRDVIERALASPSLGHVRLRTATFDDGLGQVLVSG